MPSSSSTISRHIKRTFILSLCIIGFTFFFCEFAIYYLTIWQCNWPQTDDGHNSETQLKVMLLSDTHLLGEYKGHWFDKLRREWQMWRSFQTAFYLFSPQLIFILGDIFDEGQWASEDQYERYLQTFHQLFYIDKESESKLYVVVGNHDIGFHYWNDRWLRRRFEKTFNVSNVDEMTINGVYFIRINSIAMEGDKCDLCVEAERQIQSIGRRRKSEKDTTRPILLMHFPLFRESEEVCREIDSASEEDKRKKLRPTIDTLSREATHMLMSELQPRLVLSGHSHHSCVITHADYVPEWTIASFSWRNKRNPSFLLAHFSTNHFAISKCFLPNEYFVFSIYLISAFTLICWIIYSIRIVLYKLKTE